MKGRQIRDYAARRQVALTTFRTHLDELIAFIGGRPVAPYTVVYHNEKVEPMPLMGGLPYAGVLNERLYLDGYGLLPNTLFALPHKKVVKRGNRFRESTYWAITGFYKTHVNGRVVLAVDENPVIVGSAYPLARAFTRFIDKRPEVHPLDFRIVAGLPFHLYTAEEVYRAHLEKRLDNIDDPPMEWDDIGNETRKRVTGFVSGASLNGTKRVAVVETPDTAMEAVGLALYFAGNDAEVTYQRFHKPNEVCTNDQWLSRLPDSLVITVGPASKIAEEVEKAGGTAGAQDVLRFDIGD